MEVEIVEGSWYEITLPDSETCYVPDDWNLVHEFLKDGKSISVQFHDVAWGVRFSAPGYLDCTEWEVFDHKEHAEERAKELEEEI